MPGPIEFSTISQINGMEPPARQREIRSEQSGQSFADMLSDAVNGVDASMKESDQKVQDFIAGETDNVHDVMISMQRAQMSFQMMVEIRNKAVETYQEISRMQI
jgi:flagellar hook-basal body complex protein FliE